MSKNYLELQSYFNFLDPAEQPNKPATNKVIINSNKYEVPEFENDHESIYKSNPEF